MKLLYAAGSLCRHKSTQVHGFSTGIINFNVRFVLGGGICRSAPRERHFREQKEISAAKMGRLFRQGSKN